MIARGTSAEFMYGIMNCPLGICSDDDQNVYIVDFINHRIIDWKSNATNGTIVVHEPTSENDTDKLRYPKDVIMDKENNSWIVSDHYNRRVMRWSVENNRENGEILIKDFSCYGLAMDKDRSLYVSSHYNNEVRRWKKGEQHGTLVAGGNGKGGKLNQLDFPTFICVDRDYTVYVSDSRNHRVMKWLKDSNEGMVVAGANVSAESTAHLFHPGGVIVDELGHIYVADTSTGRVTRWSQGAEGGNTVLGGDARLNYPTRLSFDREGNLYVVNWEKNEIKKFQIKG